jgi:valyl-tRNA synthetase|tara:strand:+ start:107 stop:733 length:627 start_codon:yes stop_codon:yes gene_type:complete
MDRIDNIMGKGNRHREMEVYLTTFDGEQHLRLHGWLKRNDTLVKSENIVNQDDYFGVFMVYITENQLNKLKENNTESALFMELEVMSTESDRWNLYKESNKENIVEDIKDFMFNFQIKDKKDIQRFLTQANETSLTLFKQSKDFIDDYIKTPSMSKKDKLKDIELMIEYFVEEERYEDCALLVGIKEDIVEHYDSQTETLLKKININE